MAEIQIPPPDGLSQLPASNAIGVYFLWQGQSVVYVGQSRNITQRLYGHIQDGKKRFDGMSYIPVELKRLSRVERYFIEKMLPKYNRCGIANAMRKLRDHGFAADVKAPTMEPRKRARRATPRAYVEHNTTGPVLVIKTKGERSWRLPVTLVPFPK